MRKKQWLLVACTLIMAFSGNILARISFPSVFEKTGGLSIFGEDKYAAPIADFTFSSQGDCSDQAVSFTSTSTGEGLSYIWDFGNPISSNNSSTQANPSHIFIGNPGIGTQDFLVTLTVMDKNSIEHSVKKTVSRKQIPSLTVGSDKESNNFDNLPYFIVCENGGTDFSFYNHSTIKATN